MTITIQGRPSSKKNNKRTFYNKRTGRTYLFPSKSFMEFEKSALKQLVWYSGYNIPEHTHVDFVFYQNGTQDSDNALNSIFDVLQEAGIVTDDKIFTDYSVKVFRKQKEWKTEISFVIKE